MDSSPKRSLRLLDNPEQKKCQGLNRAIPQARGKVVLIIDAHALYAPDYVSTCVETLQKTGAGNVGGPMRVRPGENTLIARAIALAHTSRFGLGGARFHDETSAGEVDTVWLGCFPREVLQKVGLFNPDFPRTEDIDLNSRLRQAGYKVCLAPQIRAWYFCRGTLRDLWRQNWANGQGVVDTLPRNGRAVGLRHLVPFLFVVSVLGLAGATLFFRPATLFLGAELSLYGGLSLLFSLQAAWRTGAVIDCLRGSVPAPARWCNRLSVFLCLPAVFAILHFSYGLGSLFRFLQPPTLRSFWRVVRPHPSPKSIIPPVSGPTATAELAGTSGSQGAGRMRAQKTHCSPPPNLRPQDTPSPDPGR